MQMLRFALQELIQERVRRGSENIFLQDGWMMSMGNKKVVKLFCRQALAVSIMLLPGVKGVKGSCPCAGIGM